jgi:lipid-binding SYLF domain-containing protein
MAATAATQFTITPLAGIDLDNKASAFDFAPLTAIIANDGRKHIVLTAQGTLGSTANVTAGAVGSATSAASAGVAQSFSVNTTGGVVTGQKFFARSNFI